MKNKKPNEYLVKGIIAASIVFLTGFLIVRHYKKTTNPAKKIEKILNAGVINCKKGNHQDGLKNIIESITLAQRKLQHLTDENLRKRIFDIKAEAVLWKGVFLLKQLQDKYSKDRYNSVLNNKTFQLPHAELNEAEEAFREVIKMKPDRAEPYRLLAYIYREKGQYLKAIETLETAIDKRDNFGEALNDLGEAYYMTKQYDKAREHYEKAIIADDKLASAHLNLGMFYYYENQASKNEKSNRKAVKHLNEFIKLGSDGGYSEDTIKAKDLLAELSNIKSK
ncbi:MAG: tetratricopeptide repeat protein [Planctomycetota bacterium]|jgi:tetratricopeptide (TPR) repeat protein